MMVPIHALQWYRFADTVNIEGTKALINVSQISVIEETADGIVIHMKGNRDVFPKENYLQIKHLIEESYL